MANVIRLAGPLYRNKLQIELLGMFYTNNARFLVNKEHTRKATY